jgi:hypothetical protein
MYLLGSFDSESLVLPIPNEERLCSLVSREIDTSKCADDFPLLQFFLDRSSIPV